MKRLLLASYSLAIPLLIGSCASNTSFDVGGRKLRTTGAPFVKLGMTGYKATEGSNTMHQTEVRPVYLPDLTVWIATRQHSEITKKASLEGDVTPPEAWNILKIQGKFRAEQKLNGDFDIITCDESMASRLNQSANRKVRDELRIWGEDARVVTTVAVAFNQSDIKDTRISGEAPAKFNAVTAKISVTNDTKHTTRLSDGTVFAYEMSRIAWQLGPNGEPEIAALIPDYLGINRIKRRGAVWDPADLKQ